MLGVGIIGCGGIGKKRAAHRPGARLVACADAQRDRAAALAAVFGGLNPQARLHVIVEVANHQGRHRVPPLTGAFNAITDFSANQRRAQYTRGTILHFTFAVYSLHSSPYFAWQTLSSSAWRLTKRAT